MADAYIYINVVFMSVCRLSLVCVWTTSRQPLNVYIIFIHTYTRTHASGVGVCSKIIILGRERAKTLKHLHVSTGSRVFFGTIVFSWGLPVVNGFCCRRKNAPRNPYTGNILQRKEGNVDDSKSKPGTTVPDWGEKRILEKILIIFFLFETRLL